jgi:protein SCO1/2
VTRRLAAPAVRAIRTWICHGLAVPSDAAGSQGLASRDRAAPPNGGAEGPSTLLPGRRVLFALAGIVLTALAILLATIWTRPADPKLDDLGTIPSFSLVDERGQPFTEAALAGHVSIVDFVFTRCDTICPVNTMKLERVQEKTFDVGERIKLVSFSVDPSYDTPAHLAEYAKRYRADATRWRFVTGDEGAMHALVEGPFMSSMMREGDRPTGAPSIAHSGYFMLVDPQLHIRGTYDTRDLQRLDEMIHDARFLARTML